MFRYSEGQLIVPANAMGGRLAGYRRFHYGPSIFWKDGTRRRPRHIMRRALGSSSSPPIDVPKSPNIYSAVILL
jgi:hypothetical protein